MRRDIAWALGFKLAALTLLYLLCFGPSHQKAVTATGVTRHLIGPTETSEGR